MKARNLLLLLVISTAVIMTTTWQAHAAAGPQVFAGPSAYSSFLVDGAGTLSAWGANGSGSLGLGSYANQPAPSAVPFPSGVHGWRTVVTANGFNANWTYALGDDGQLYGAGNLSFVYYSSLTLVPRPPGAGSWITVAASDLGWLAISTNGSIYGIINGPVFWPPTVGVGPARWTQVAVRAYPSTTEQQLFALDNRGKIFGMYYGTASIAPQSTEIPIPSGATAWTTMAAGDNFVLALANDGNLYGWGHNESGQLGQGSSFVYTNTPLRITLPPGKTGWKTISAGGSHSMAITTDGQLFVWGYNSYGELGLGDNNPSRFSPTAVPNLTNITSIAAGYRHSLAVSDCQVLAWGQNAAGALGVGFTSAYYPLPIGSLFSYDICSTNPPSLPSVSIIAADPTASEGTWLSAYGETNTGLFVISRAVATPSSLEVKLSLSGTASNGVDYFSIPSSITIPANSNSVPLFVNPKGSTLASDPSTVIASLLPDAAYQLANATTATVTLAQYESEPGPPLLPTGIQLQLFVGTNSNGQTLVIQASTNLANWDDLGIGTNVFGVVTITETNRFHFVRRFFRALPVSSP